MRMMKARRERREKVWKNIAFSPDEVKIVDEYCREQYISFTQAVREAVRVTYGMQPAGRSFASMHKRANDEINELVRSIEINTGQRRVLSPEEEKAARVQLPLGPAIDDEDEDEDEDEEDDSDDGPFTP